MKADSCSVFPGIGFGALACGANTISDKMITASAIALGESLNEEETKAGLLYPRLDRIREISAAVSAGLVRQAQKEGVDTNESLRGLGEPAPCDTLTKLTQVVDDAALFKAMLSLQWHP